MIALPGASRLRNGAAFEYAATSPVPAQKPSSGPVQPAPMLMTFDRQAGAASASLAPSLPAATTVAMPAERSSATASLSAGWAASQVACSRYRSVPARLRFTAAMRNLPLSSWIFSSARRRSLSQAPIVPSASRL